MNGPPPAIIPEERALAAWTHLSGLSGYLIPLGGILVPIIIWVAKKDSRVVSSIAKQAIVLNVAVYLAIAVTAILWITILLIPVVVLFWVALGVVAIALPVIGAIRAWEGSYYRYPLVGISPT